VLSLTAAAARDQPPLCSSGRSRLAVPVCCRGQGASGSPAGACGRAAARQGPGLKGGWRGRQEQRWLHGVDVTGSRFLGRPEVLRAAHFAAEAHAGQVRRPLGPWPACAARARRPRSALSRRPLRPCKSARRPTAEQTQPRGAERRAAAESDRLSANVRLVVWCTLP